MAATNTATATPVTGTTKSQVSYSNLKKGDVLSETQYYKVEEVRTDLKKVKLINDAGDPIVVDKDYIETCIDSANQHSKTEKLSRTELIAKFMAYPYTAMTVNFNKKVDEKEVLKEILDAHSNTAPKDVEKAFKATIKKALTGEERTAVGRHFGHMNEFGRINFIDMNKDKGTTPDWDARNIQVDPRTINWLIVKGVKYEAK